MRFFWNGPEPDRVTTEAATKRPVRIIDLHTLLSKTRFFKDYPYFTNYVISAASYPGVTHEVPTFGISILWFAHHELSPPLVQKMVATVYSPEGHAHMLNIHAAAKDMTPSKALLGVTIPLHKGAEAHWKSVGLEIPEEIRAR